MASSSRFLLRAVIAIAGAASCATACSSKNDKLPPPLDNSGSTTPPPGGGGNGGGVGDSGAGSDAACAPIANNGGLVNETYVGETAPLPIGGTIAAGTYYLTGAFVYTGMSGSAGPTGRVLQQTMTFDGANFADAEGVGDNEGGALAASYASGSYSAAGSQLTLTATCPASASATMTYTVTGSALHLYQGATERVLTLQ